MRVTLVSPFDPYPPAVNGNGAHVGGVERVLGEFSRELARRGHDVTLVCSQPQPGSTNVEEGVRVVRVRRRFTVMRAPVARLAQAIPTDSDIIQVAATYPFTTPPVLRRARALRIRSILDFHFEPGPGTPLGRLAASVYRRLGPSAYYWADGVLVRSVAYGRTAPSLSIVPEERWRVVPNGVDTSRFRPTKTTTKGDYFLFVGRLVPYKGVDVLIRAVALANAGLPLLIAGDGPMRKKLQHLAKELRVDAHFLGHVSDDELPALYSGATVTVLPSVTQQEAFGLVLLESMACGTPVVASALPGVEEIALTGGLVAPPGDAEQLAEQLRRALEPDLLPRGDALSRRVRDAYSWQAVTDRLEAVYQEVLESPLPTLEVKPVARPRRHSVL